MLRQKTRPYQYFGAARTIDRRPPAIPGIVAEGVSPSPARPSLSPLGLGLTRFRGPPEAFTPEVFLISRTRPPYSPDMSSPQFGKVYPSGARIRRLATGAPGPAICGPGRDGFRYKYLAALGVMPHRHQHVGFRAFRSDATGRNVGRSGAHPSRFIFDAVLPLTQPVSREPVISASRNNFLAIQLNHIRPRA
jgi:hypothetical protein